MSCLYRDYRRVEGFDDYIVSNYGEVWSLKGRSPRLIKQAIDNYGYYTFVLCKNTYRKSIKTHTLVGDNFIGKRIGAMTFDHVDRNRTNNRSDNIRLATRSEQCVNRKQFKNNTTGHTNIYYQCDNKRDNKYYIIKIQRNKKKVLDKCFNIKNYTLEDVIKIRDDFLTKLKEC